MISDNYCKSKIYYGEYSLDPLGVDMLLAACYSFLNAYINFCNMTFFYTSVHLQNGYTFEKEVEALLDNSSIVNSPSVSVYSQNCYDATWILALALNESITSKYKIPFTLYMTCEIYITTIP